MNMRKIDVGRGRGRLRLRSWQMTDSTRAYDIDVRLRGVRFALLRISVTGGVGDISGHYAVNVEAHTGPAA